MPTGIGLFVEWPFQRRKPAARPIRAGHNRNNMKKILLMYPHNFFEERSGINARYLELLKYFKSRRFQVDLFTLKGFKSDWDTYPPDRSGLVSRIFFHDFRKSERWQRFRNRKENPFAWLRKKLPFCRYAYLHLPDFAHRGFKKRFRRVVAENNYDYIIISYVYWAGLIDPKPVPNCTTVLDLSDFMTMNMFDRLGGAVKTTTMIKEESRRVDLFDMVLCISEEERLFFSQFAQRPKYHFVPFFMDDQPKPAPVTDAPPPHDLLFIGSDNPHNQKGIQWFLQEVYPLLEDKPRLLLAGPVTQHIPEPYGCRDTITCLPMVKDLAALYKQARVSICPLLGGTGMKIKVVEALSFGMPVVTTYKGVIGFPVKSGNGCLTGDSAEDFAESIQLLLRDPLFYEVQQKAAKKFFLEHFVSSTVYRRLDEIFKINGVD